MGFLLSATNGCRQMSKKIRNSLIKKTNSRSRVGFVRTSKLSEEVFLRPSFLYRFVYSSRLSFLAAFLILISFSLQGVENVYAAEEVAAPVAVTETGAESTSSNYVSEDVSITDGEVIAEVLDTTTENIIVETETDLSNTGTTTTASTTEDINPDGETDSVVDNMNANSENETINDEEESASESTEDASVAVTNESVNISENDSAFSFNKDECTQLATGSFYCLLPQENILEDALFSAPDSDGDMEIFFVKDGVQAQITKNTYDDAAPYYDQNSHTIVWHRLIDDRYQVVVYDIETNEERQLTSDNTNNMEPNRQGDYIVWQRWIDGGWNIILLDGEKETQITKTTSHNVAPYIHGALVVWNRHAIDGGKTIEMYDIASRTYVTVEDPDGLSVSNPRMVFVYDSLHPNGDIVTKGYDLLAKRFIELDSLPRDLPDEIPQSDSTGETRALIQSKPSPKSEVEESMIDGNISHGSGPDPLITNHNSTSTLSNAPTTLNSALSINSTATTSDMVLDLSIPVETPVPKVEEVAFDLVIPSLAVDQSVSTSSVQN